MVRNPSLMLIKNPLFHKQNMGVSLFFVALMVLLGFSSTLWTLASVNVGWVDFLKNCSIHDDLLFTPYRILLPTEQEDYSCSVTAKAYFEQAALLDGNQASVQYAKILMDLYPYPLTDAAKTSIQSEPSGYNRRDGLTNLVLGEASYRNGDIVDAGSLWRAYDKISVFWQRADVFASVGDDLFLRLEVLRRQIAISPHDVDILLRLASVYHQIGDYSDALSMTEQAIALAPENVYAQYRLAFILFFAYGRSIEARELLTSSSFDRAAPSLRFEAKMLIGLSYLAEDRFEEAIDSFELAASIQGVLHERAYIQLSEVNARLGDKAKAQFWLNKTSDFASGD